ncbi:MAG: orotate phosphoribosyltransferase [Candidatus Diapherotrites archaeon]|nr:orotate phosphoribosyltransferase [Candidatus Diapherotrites archaeon]
MEFDSSVAKALLNLKAVSINTNEPFRYSSGILSPIYTDCRILISDVEKRKLVVDGFIELLEKEIGLENIDLIAGTATAGIPHAAFISERLNIPMIYVRAKKKEHGKQNMIEGKLTEGQKVVVIEDLISTGGSSINVANAIREKGGIVNNCMAIFSYGFESSKNAFEENNIKLSTQTNLPNLLNVAVENNYLSQNQQDQVMSWIADPAGWEEKRNSLF